MLERVAYRDAKQIQSKNVYSGLYVVFEVEVAVMLVEELAVCVCGGVRVWFVPRSVCVAILLNSPS